MANANTQLQSILAQFAGRSDVTPDQEAQLRATIASDPDLTQRLNQEAASGHLKGFLPGVGGSEPLTGSYDKASGIVTSRRLIQIHTDGELARFAPAARDGYAFRK